MVRQICMLSVHGDPLGILGTPDTGGQCLYVREIVKELSRVGFNRIDSYTRFWGNKPKIEEIENLKNCRVIRIPCGDSSFIPKEQLKPYLLEFYENLKKFISKEELKYDLVHSHYWDGGLVGTWMANDFKIPLIHTSHSLGVVKKETAAEKDNIDYSQRIIDEKNIYNLASGVIAESTQEKRDLQILYGTDENKIHIIPAGVDINWFYPRGSQEEAKKILGFKEEILILSLGRLDSRKGFDLFIKSIPYLMESLKPIDRKKVNIVISAGDTKKLSVLEQKEFDYLMSLTSDLGISDIFKIIPRIEFEKVPLWYTAADVFIVPSRYETFGLVIVEAMACETPVVATNVGGPPDIITDGVEGYTADPTDAKTFGLRISEVIKNPETHQKMSENAKKTAIRKFSWTAVTNQIVNLYEKVLE